MKEQTEEDYKDNYKNYSWWIFRYIFFVHLMPMMVKIRKILSTKEVHQQGIDVEDTPNITLDESCRNLSAELDEVIQSYVQNEPLNDMKMFKVVLRTYGWKVLYVGCLYFMEGMCRIGSSIVVFTLIESVSTERSDSYMWAGVLVAVYFVASIFRHNSYYEAPLLSARIRSAFIYLLYQRVSKLSQFVVRSADMAKVVNLLASDFNTMEARLIFVFTASSFPFIVIGVVILLVIRLGPIGIVGVLFPIALMPITWGIGVNNGKIMGKLNVFKDSRIKITSEIIEGIRFVKLYAWELAFKKIVGRLRQSEIAKYVGIIVGQSLERAFSNSTTYWGLLICFWSASNSGSTSAAVIFSTFEVMTFFKANLFLSSMGISYLYELKVLFKRFSDIYNLENVSMRCLDSLPGELPYIPRRTTPLLGLPNTQDSLLDVEQPSQLNLNPSTEVNLPLGEVLFSNFNGYFSLTDTQKPTLKSINLSFKKGAFYGIAGKVGSGKSAILSSILEEIPQYRGILKYSGTLAYVEQEPYIFAGTIRDNITFGKPYQPRFYDQVVRYCCLESDFKLFPNRDLTEVGERGITVSGGQKARLSLARAVYSRADIYLLDDPISAVDAKVARRLYEDVMKRMLRDKTVILVTHQVHYLMDCNEVIIMEDGRVKTQGTPETIMKQLRELMIEEESEGQQANHLSHERDEKSEETLPTEQPMRKKSMSKEEPPKSDGKLTSNEKEESIQVTFGTYMKYILYSKKYYLLPITLIMFFGAEAANTAFFRSFASFTSQGAQPNYWLNLAMIQLAFFVILVIKYFLLNFTVLKSNETLHEKMLVGLLRSPTRYFDATPTGRLINRFSNDLSILDGSLAYTLIDTIEGPIITLVMLGNLIQINPYFAIATALNLAFQGWWFFYCKRTIIQAKQLDLRMKSPVFSEFIQLSNGSTQVRIYGQTEEMQGRMSHAVNRSIRANHGFWFASRAFGVYASYVSVAVCAVGFLAGISEITSGGLYGMTIMYLTTVSDMTQWFLRQMITTESMMVSVERGFGIANLESEAPLRTEYDETIGFKEQIQAEQNDRPALEQQKSKWPPVGSIAFDNFTMRYRKELEPVLRQLNFEIEGGKKVGIVGRTGAGKSSIIQALFRMVEADPESQLSIGGNNAQLMGLHSLRKNITIIPQTPFLFKGTIRQNIDPFDEYSDEKLWQVLEQSNLLDYIQSLKEKLETDISNASETFSVGQKQLICLARALLRSNKILVLDQATSNVDMRTDEFIQTTLKEKFRNYTIITIAHRLNTIADYDMVIVMDKGKVIDLGSPFRLLVNSITDTRITGNGPFADMVRSTGSNATAIFQVALRKFKERSLRRF